MTEGSVEWEAAMQRERYREARVTTAMQAIGGVPVFDGRSVDLEYFLKRMELIIQQVSQHPLDESTNGIILGYFYSRIAVNVLTDIGITWETPWEQVKALLREKYGGTGKSIPKLILREVLIDREQNQGVTEYAKSVLMGVRKVAARFRDSGRSPEEIRARCELLDELAQECINSNLPRRTKQWVRLNKPTSLDGLVKTIEEEEQEERDERRKPVRIRGTIEREGRVEMAPRLRPYSEWQVTRREGRRGYSDKPKVHTIPDKGRPRGQRMETRVRGNFGRARQCWECREEGHFARECPYMYRREPRRNYREEPMDVNTVQRKYRKRDSEQSGTDSESSSSETVSGGSDMSDNRKSWADRVRVGKRVAGPLKAKKE